jgi:hypothetical protein
MKYGVVGLMVVGIIWTTMTPVHAEDAPGSLGTWGAGTESCGWYLAHSTPDALKESSLSHWMAESWVQGYLTAIAFMARWPEHEHGWTLKVIDLPALDAWLGLYCSQHPLTQLSQATIQLMSELRMYDPVHRPTAK